MRLIKLTMVESAGHAECPIRPYEMNYKKHYVDDIARVTEEGHRLTPVRLAKVASGILAPSSDTLLTSHIDGGWDQKRIMFAMVVEIASREVSREYVYIVGHTDHSDFSNIGTRVKFDPRMRMYFNSITRIDFQDAIRGRSHVWQPKIQTHDQILNRSSVMGGRKRGSNGERAVSLRPADLFRRKEAEVGFGGMLDEGSLTGGNTNLVGAFMQQLRSSTLENNDPATFLARGLSAYARANADPDGAYIGDADLGDVIAGATDRVDENVLDQDPYIEELRIDTNILEDGYVTFGDLMRMNPDFDEDRQLPFQDLRGRKNYYDPEQQAGWRGSDPNTIAAVIIANSLPSYMINAMYSKMDDLIIRSHARMGQEKVISGKTFPFVDGLSVRATMTYFEDMVESVLLPMLTNNGAFEVNARINCNIDQDIEIWLTIDDGEESFHVFPAFAGALMAPTLSNNLDAVSLLSKSLVDLSGAIVNRAYKDSPNSSDTGVVSLSTDVQGSRAERDRRDDRDSRSRDRGHGRETSDW